jgi:hypothetical protein
MSEVTRIFMRKIVTDKFKNAILIRDAFIKADAKRDPLYE